MKKRNLIASLTLSLSLLFSKPRLNFSQLSSPSSDNRVAQVKIIDDKEFEDNDQRVILIKNPSPSKPPTLRTGVVESLTNQGHFNKPSGGKLNGSKGNNFRSPRGFIEANPNTGARRQQTRFGGKGNPSSGGSSANSDDGIPKIPQKVKTYDYDYRLNLKKKESAEQCELNDNLNNMPEFGPILEGSVVPLESLLGTSSGFKAQYKNLKKNSIPHKQAMASIEKLAAGSLKIGDKNIRKIRGMKNIYEAKSKYARVYFQINGDTVQIILPALKIDQKQSIKLLKKYFK